MSKFNSRKKFESTQTGGGGGDIRRFKFVVGLNVVRIAEDNFEDAWIHYFKNAEGEIRRAVCLGKGKCPLCEKGEKASHRFYFNVIDKKSKKKQVKQKLS